MKSLMKNELRLSVSQIRKLKAASAIFVNNNPVFTNYRVCAGDVIYLIVSEPPADFPPEEDGVNDLRILYEDEYLLGIDKPQGMLIHPSHSRLTGTLANYALAHILHSGGDGCHAVNRLDRDTSGIVLFAKSGYVKSLMPDLIKEKEYMAAVCGTPDPLSGTVELPIKRAREGDMLRIVAADGAYCRTDYTAIRSSDGISILRLSLATGRTHQIRVHCRAIGCPVLGDRLYSTDDSLSLTEKLGANAQYLHAIRLVFDHPFTGEEIELQSLPIWNIPCVLQH